MKGKTEQCEVCSAAYHRVGSTGIFTTFVLWSFVGQVGPSSWRNEVRWGDYFQVRTRYDCWLILGTGDASALPGIVSYMRFRLFPLGFAILLVPFGFSQVTLNQVDTFQDGTNLDWSGGSTPTNIATGGPAGSNDRYLQISSTGGKLATYNLTQWSGNYVTAGVTRIEFDLKNLGPTDLVIRLVLMGPDSGMFGARWSSTAVCFLPSGGAWTHFGFDLISTNFVQTQGTSTFASMLASMDRIMLRHEPIASPTGTPVTGILGIDNVASPAPPPVFDFVLNKSQVAGQNFVQGTVSIPQAVGTATSFQITDSTSLITTPASVSITAGQTLRNFAIQTAAVNFPVSATVSAKRGTVTITRNLTLIALIPTALAFTPTAVVGGNPVSCRVVVNGVAGPSGRTIAVFDNSTSTTMPSTVTVPPGGTEVSFQITTLPVTATKVVTVTARVTQGEKTGTFRINP
jgi:hypothetical protein